MIKKIFLTSIFLIKERRKKNSKTFAIRRFTGRGPKVCVCVYGRPVLDQMEPVLGGGGERSVLLNALALAPRLYKRLLAHY